MGGRHRPTPDRPFGYDPDARKRQPQRVRPPHGYKPSGKATASTRDYWPAEGEPPSDYWAPQGETGGYHPGGVDPQAQVQGAVERQYAPKRRSRKSPKGYWRRNPYLSKSSR